MSLVDFLRARIADEERQAQSAIDGAPPWSEAIRSAGEVKRTMLDLHVSDDPDGEVWDPACTLVAGGPRVPDDCPTLRTLAQAYAEHPGYRDEWRPPATGRP